MKKVFLSLAVVAFAMSFTSCKKCVECTHSSAFFSDTEYCSGNKSSRDSYKAAQEFAGYTCK